MEAHSARRSKHVDHTGVRTSVPYCGVGRALVEIRAVDADADHAIFVNMDGLTNER